jgi:group II intron reverse transcriptase/maturase
MNIGEMQRKLSFWADQDAERKFYGLFDLICNRDWLWLAYERVAQNAGSKTAGCDGINVYEFMQDEVNHITRLHAALRSGKFEPCPVRRVYIPKSNDKMRPLGIPSFLDRIVQEAVRMALEPIFEADFDQHSWGFRPNRCTMDAVSYLYRCSKESMKYFWVIEGDISAYFDTINHRRLMKLLRRRIDDEKLLDLIWGFLRSGVMERKLFKDTLLGTPQGGIISPLLANVYLHELDLFMRRHCDLTHVQKYRGRKRNLANFVYARYADDFVILCNGTQEQALEMREEANNFLRDSLHLTLSLEKTKVTHVNDGYDFLGFRLKRGMGHAGTITKVLVPDKALKKHRDKLRAALAPNTCDDSITAKLLAVNRIIGGWCRYYQCAGLVAHPFGKMQNEAFWLFAHWLGRKHKMKMTTVMRTFYTYRAETKAKVLSYGDRWLVRHTSFKAKRYLVSPFKPNPYITQERIEREELLDTNPWLGSEERPGMADLRLLALERDGYKCCECKEAVTNRTAQVDHKRAVSRFKRPVDANRLENLQTFCIPCHARKTRSDRQLESCVR